MEKLKKIFGKAHDRKVSILMIGNYGIGKSQIVYEYAKEKAKEMNKELVVWHELTKEQKKDVYDNIDKYFILVDIKLQTIGDPSKLTGIPIIVNGDGNHKVMWEMPFFLKTLAKENATGVLFLDEINMATVSLQSTAFEILLQRKVGEWKISDNVLIIGAGNPIDVNSSANEIPKPLINRCIFIKFDGFNTDEWIRWASENGIDGRIISFVKLFDELIKDSGEQFEQETRPRSYELLSKMIKGEDDIDYIENVAYATLNMSTASKFVKFIKVMDKLDYKKYLEKPKLIEELTNEEKYALVSIIIRKLKEIDTNKLVKFIEYLSNDILELSAVMLSLIKAEHGKRAVAKIIAKLDEKIVERIVYLVR